jgi:hypothetical protein
MQHPLLKKTSFTSILILLFVFILPIIFSEKAEAAGFTQAYIRFDHMASNTATTGMICAKPSSTLTTYRKLEVTFPDENSATDFVVSTTAANWQSGNISTSSIDGNTAWPDITNTTASISGNIVTWTHTADQTLSSSNTYCFRWTNTAALTTPTTGGASSLVGTARALNSSDSELMNSKYSTAIISNDQIVVSATVPPTFTFSLSGNTDSLGTLSSASIASSSGKTVTLATNAASGWVVWVKSANAALNSASTGATIATAGSLDNTPTDLASTTGYVLDVNITTDSGTGTGTVSQASNYGAEYNGTSTTEGGTLSTTFQPIAAANGTTDGDYLTLIERAKISAVQAAATDYTDTLTVVAAGRF